MENKNINVQRRFRRRKLASPVGMLFLLFAVIGLLAVLFVLFEWTQSLLDDSDKKKQYEHFMRPVVMMDPVPFQDIQNVDEQMLLQTALWSALLAETAGKYSYDENGMLLVPSTDVDVAAGRLYGPTVVLNHHTFDDYDGSYLFDPELKAYRVPLIAKVAYSPSVTNIAKNGDGTITLTVGYIPPGNIFTTGITKDSVKEGEAIADKYMLYDLQKGEDAYFIKAIRDLDAAAPARS